MPAQLPPLPEGRTSGFPYSLLWEEFAQIWEDLGDRPGQEEAYESLLTKAAECDISLDEEPSASAIRAAVQPLELSTQAEEELVGKLYRLAAAYRIPRLKKALGQDAAATKSHLNELASAAAKFADLLDDTPLDQEVLLGLLRSHVDPAAEMPLFHLKAMAREAQTLAATAEMMAKEIPQMPRGATTDILKARLMEAATRLIGSSASDYLEYRQADSAGRNPRPTSNSARVLFAYLKLVDPSLTNTTIVRLLKGHDYGLKRVTRRELEGPPKAWPHHVARKKLTR